MIKIKKRGLIIFFIVFVSFLVASFHKNDFTGLKNIFVYPLDVFNYSISYIKETLGNIFILKKENEKLKKELYELKMERHRYSEIILENERLKKILSIKDSEPSFFAVAKTIGRGYDSLLNTIIIDKGKKEGIKKDMAVITPNGLIGKIYNVRDSYSEVILLRDPNFSVSVRLQKSRQEGIVSGIGKDYYLLKYIPQEQTVEKGEIVITSGLDGIFPPGILVGAVNEINSKSNDFFQYIEVVPFQVDSKIEEVIILKPYSKDGR